MSRPALGPLCLFATSTMVALTTCAPEIDICAPVQTQVGFFSQGDCILTRSSTFQGHEWLTFLGNEDLGDQRFSEADVQSVVDGNRRVDWPIELLVHLNNGPYAYINALLEYTDRPDVQKHHYLLRPDNTSEEAVAEANAYIRQLTVEAARLWIPNREKALTKIGQAQHTLQDSFSEAHARRDPDHPTHPWCLVQVKSFVPREVAHDAGRGVLFHGGDKDDSVGHTTSQDSIYVEGRGCRSPATRDAVESCLSEAARRARRASRDHLALILESITSAAEDEVLDELVHEKMDDYIAENLSPCP